MRVLLISHTCQSRTEGQPRAASLSRLAGVELKVLVPDRWYHYGRWRGADRGGDDGEGGPPIDLEVGRVALPWAGPGQFYLHWYPALRRTLRAFRPDVIDLWEEPWGLVAAHACWLRNRVLPAAKIVVETEQNLDKDLPPPFGWFRRYALANADYVVGRNRESLAVVCRHGYRGPAEVVPNAVDADLFRPLDRAACRAALGLTGFAVGYVGRLVAEKGLDDLLAAVALCPADVNVLFVGDGPMAAELGARAAALGVAGRVRLLPARPFASLPAVMNAVDCLALPSRTTGRWKEQFGRVIIEAHACGTPVVGSDSGAIPDVVGDGGLVVPERDPAALAAALTRLARDPGLARRMGAAGRAAALSRYTWASVAARMQAIYRRACGGGDAVPNPDGPDAAHGDGRGLNGGLA
jgi:glycosyltransferase involved in cell wall biosynthesis